MIELLFPLGGVRLTTILAISLFLAIAITRGNRKPAYACLAWLFGFEAVFEATSLVTGHGETLGPLHAAIYVAIAVALLPWLYRRGVRPSWPLLAAALIFFAVWILTGFHVNQHTGRDFSASAEVWNEVSKTLWAASYLVPLLSRGLELAGEQRHDEDDQGDDEVVEPGERRGDGEHVTSFG